MEVEGGGGNMRARRTSYIASILLLLIAVPLHGQASPVLSTSYSSVVSFSHQCNDHAYLLCDLTFATDLQTLQHPEVTCKTLSSNATQPELDTPVEKEWTFLTELGNTVYKVEAALTLDTTPKVAIYYLNLCFSNACFSQSPTCLSFQTCCGGDTGAKGPFISSTAMSSSESSYLMNSNAEGFVFNTGHGESSSSESAYSGSNAEGFVFNMGSGDSSSPNESSNPEGFIFNFGSASSATDV